MPVEAEAMLREQPCGTACEQEGNPRTFKEMCAVVTEASKKDIGRCYNFIVKELEQVRTCLSPAPVEMP